MANKYNISNNNNINIEVKKNSLLQDLQKKKTNIKEDIERMNIKNENKQKIESATDIIKNRIQKDKEINDYITQLYKDYSDNKLVYDDISDNDKELLKMRKNMHKSYAMVGESDADGKLEDLAELARQELAAQNP